MCSGIVLDSENREVKKKTQIFVLWELVREE